jgi:hypothetical protein
MLEDDHSTTASAEVKNTWAYTSTHQYVFMTYCVTSKVQGQPYIYLFIPQLKM